MEEKKTLLWLLSDKKLQVWYVLTLLSTARIPAVYLIMFL